MDKFNFFIPIAKVDAERHEVWGFGGVEEPDASNEIMDYATTKPNVQKWSEAVNKRSGGKSLGNVRSMHSNIAAGKLIDLQCDDVHKGFFLGAKIVDDNEWKKVEAGVYTGFSIGGAYEKRWMDNQNLGKTRYTARPSEWSIVDAPCMPSATFQMVKAEGIEILKFAPGNAGAAILLEADMDDLEKVAGDREKAIPGPVLDGVAPVSNTDTAPAPMAGIPSASGLPVGSSPIAPIPLDSEVGPNFEAQKMPMPNNSMEVTKDTPSQEALASNAVFAKDLSAEFEAWLPKVGALVKQVIQEELAKQETTSAPAGRKMISVKRKLIKVTKEK
jgi:hypothetical protein